jgi:hypothetical protein
MLKYVGVQSCLSFTLTGTSVVSLSTRDVDFGDNGTVVYNLMGITNGTGADRAGYFAINDITGEVKTSTVAANLDREVSGGTL